ncbi:hypothetical protein IG626_14280 [Desulfovibrio desulfuricans]|uniref:phosphorylase family protein n=1 Tax=Desulfovibrio desulfuricans TaxID=876 RepID=UPI0017830D2F|nr:hypothetical protein [Desulfovibrio desulfuricans]MBD8897164.1 hypothetical protein [Desulfovibrio desulfuricans]
MIRVLIVDDCREKICTISDIIKKAAPNAVFDIISAGYGNQARDFLSKFKFDILIIDISLPRHVDGKIIPDEGITILKSIIGSNGRYKVPNCIIGTSFNETIIETAKEAFVSMVNQFIPFSTNSDKFCNNLTSRIVQYVNSLSSNVEDDQTYESFCCVFCALREEFDALLKIGWEWTAHRDELHNIYHTASLVVDGEEKKIIALCINKMGMVSTSIAACKLINLYKPRYVSMLGIAAASPGKEAHLGDILIASPIWDWSVGKLIPADGHYVLQAEPYQIDLDMVLRNQLLDFCQNTSVLNNIYSGWPASKPSNVLRAHLGPMASGPSVVASTSAFNSIFPQHRKLIGIDMESYALFEAARSFGCLEPKVFTMKSVVDFADENKNDNIHDYACYTSSQAFKFFVEEYLLRN